MGTDTGGVYTDTGGVNTDTGGVGDFLTAHRGGGCEGRNPLNSLNPLKRERERAGKGRMSIIRYI